ncbi:MAG: hypothetical protein IKT41_03785 [Clostridia bacterium]|nr:hypothetical protein [Clostridia bacterium]
MKKIINIILVLIVFMISIPTNIYAKTLDEYLKEDSVAWNALKDFYEIECQKDLEKYKAALRSKTLEELEGYLSSFHPSSQTDYKAGLKAVIIEKEDNIKYSQILDGDNFNMWYPTSTGSNIKTTAKVNTIAKIIRALGTVVSVGALAIIGMRIMFGSIEQKAQYKELLVPYLIGAVMLFGISWVTSFIFEVVN